MRAALGLLVFCAVALASARGEEGEAKPETQEMVYMVFTPQCFDTLVIQRQLDMDCAKKTVAKLLGFGITAGAAIVKMPQIINMVAAGSAGGISFMATFTELIGNTWASAYNAQLGNPLSSYGEAPLVALQNAVILLLVVLLGTRGRSSGAKTAPADKADGKKKKTKTKKNKDKADEPEFSALSLTVYGLAFVLAVLAPWFVSLTEYVAVEGKGDYSSLANLPAVWGFIAARVGVVKPSAHALTLLRYLYMANTALFASSRLPQIATNAANGHMGTQSPITLLLQALGTSARIFTALTETADDPLLAGSFIISAILNWALFVQYVWYMEATAQWKKEQAGKQE